jgi:N-acetylglucosamine kinase-like BadF-type ATPase
MGPVVPGGSSGIAVIAGTGDASYKMRGAKYSKGGCDVPYC